MRSADSASRKPDPRFDTERPLKRAKFEELTERLPELPTLPVVAGRVLTLVRDSSGVCYS